MFTTLPLLPPPPSTLLPSATSPFTPSYTIESPTGTNYPSTLAQHQQAAIQHRSSRPSRPLPASSSSSARGGTSTTALSLAALGLDERLLEARKRAIAMYGAGWLRPAGCAKTMLGRREEEAERDEVERQLREVEEQEALALAGEEEATRRRRSGLAEGVGAEQNQGQGLGQGEGDGERDLDEEIPEAEQGQLTHGGEEENDEEDDEDDEEEEEGRDLDDDVPDADLDQDGEGDRTGMTFGNTTTMTDMLLEGETGITDEVEGASLLEQGQGLGSVRSAMVAGRFREFAEREQEALANAMLDEDEQGMAERDMEGAAGNGMGERELDAEVPEPEDAGEWQHTDTEEEEEEEEEESGMDISNLDHSALPRRHGLTPGQSSVAMPGTEEPVGSPGSGRRWFSGGARRNLFGRGTGSLFGLTPPQQQQQESDQLGGAPAAPRRRSGRVGRENRARDSLD